MQQDFQQWSDMLHFTGGALNFNKCSYHITYYEFTRTGKPYLTDPLVNQDITIQENNTNQIIKKFHHDEEAKTLGVRKCPAGTVKEWYAQLTKTSQNYGRIILLSSCEPSEALTFLYSIYYPSITHAFSTSHFTKSQLDLLGRSALNAILRKSGYCGSTPLEIRNGPNKYGGIAFRSLYCEQGIQQLLLFIKHWRTPGPVNKHLQIAISWLQLSLGISFSLFENTKINLPHLEGKWFKELRNFLQQQNINIILQDNHIPKLQRENDFHIMDHIIKFPEKYTRSTYKQKVQQIHYCCKYLQVTTIADMTNAAGTHIDTEKFKGNPTHTTGTTKLVQFKQGKPYKTA